MTTNEAEQKEREVDDPEFSVFAAKMPDGMAGMLEAELQRRRNRKNVAKEVMSRSKAISLELVGKLMEELAPDDESLSRSERMERLADNVTLLHAAASLVVSRTVMATWSLAGSKVVERTGDLIEAGLDGFLGDLVAGKPYDGPVIQKPEWFNEEDTTT